MTNTLKGTMAFMCDCPPGFSGRRCEVNRDDCETKPCRHGQCIDGNNSFKCICEKGYTGALCDRDINECDSNPCENSATCENTGVDYKCHCLPGTYGVRCQINVNECSSNPCLNGATCHDDIDGYMCECVTGFGGANCQLDIDECAVGNELEEEGSGPCRNGGVCIDLIGHFHCDCPIGLFGPTCESDVNECASQPCKNGGTCENGFNEFVCTCQTGYEGRTCEMEIDLCDSNPCQHGGSCYSPYFNEYACQCQDGFMGKDCEINIDDCSNSPCRNGGTCIDLINSYKCICSPPYSGSTCQSVLDPCGVSSSSNSLMSTLFSTQQSDGPCQNGATCHASPSFDDYHCSCLIGFTGRHCQEDIDECALLAPCRNGATCHNSPSGSYTCECRSGFTGRDCLVNVDDCGVSSRCQNGATCIDGVDSFTCLCVPGFGGESCSTDLDECESQPCLNGAVCHDYVNSFTCSCQSGFSGTRCELNDEDCTSSSCMNGGTCVDGVNNYTCLCPHDFTGSHCQHLKNPCDDQPCQYGGRCVTNEAGYYVCQCPKGRTGPHCEHVVDWCSSTSVSNPASTAGLFELIPASSTQGGGSPCMNGGVCEQRGVDFHCTCPDGWMGKICDVRMVSCDVALQSLLSSPNNHDSLCLNGGRCQNIHHRTSLSVDPKKQQGQLGHECICPDGYTDSYCQTDINECEVGGQPCQNGATCQDLIGTYQCLCPTGFQGRHCEFNIDNCAPNNPCQNGGICHDLVNNFRCSCPHGTRGLLCEINDNECFEGACHHGGQCIDQVGGYKCICSAGYVGSRCEGDVNECLSSPCSPSGTRECVQLVDNYQCRCRPGYEGRHCQIKNDFCFGSISGPCHNGGTCSNVFNEETSGFRCHCPVGHYGSECQYSGLSACESRPCLHGGSCVTDASLPSQFRCICRPGTSGNTCELDTRNECTYDPCRNRGQCIDKVGDYACSCKKTWKGKNCDIRDVSSMGGIDRTTFDESMSSSSMNGGGYNEFSNIIDPYMERQKCVLNECQSKKGDNRCDEECNTVYCDNDGGDCRIGLNPWKNCNVTLSSGLYCWNVFQDGKCDEACNTGECLFDGRDCDSYVRQCNPNYDVFCADNYANGVCDPQCNNAPCGWDGLDCEKKRRSDDTKDEEKGNMSEDGSIIPGSFYVVLSIPKQTFLKKHVQKQFERYLSLVLRSNFRIKRDEKGDAMIQDFNPLTMDSDTNYAVGQSSMIMMGNLGTVVYLEIDNVKCDFDGSSESESESESEDEGDNCFESAAGYANLFGAMMGAEKLSDDWGIVQVGADGKLAPNVNRDKKFKGNNSTVIGVTVSCGIIFTVILIGIMTNSNLSHKRKKIVKGMTWFPAGFVTNTSNNNASRKRKGSSPDEASHVGQSWSDDDESETASEYGVHKDNYLKMTGPFYESNNKRVKTSDVNNQWIGMDNNNSFTANLNHQQLVQGASPYTRANILTPPQNLHDSPFDVDDHGSSGKSLFMDHGQMKPISVVKTPSKCEGDDMLAIGMTPLMAVTAFHSDGISLSSSSFGGSTSDEDETSTTSATSCLSPSLPMRNGEGRKKQRNSSNTAKKRATNRRLIRDLLSSGADINAQMQRTGESTLHLAARFSRSDVCIELLGEGTGADVNVIDNSGRTPLHSAIASDAQGVMRILLKHPQVDVNAKSNDGTCPLILAARLAIESAVELLLEHKADINLADESGKSALHWAALVNNVDAVNVLLANGANRDIQDSKDQTPLFLAAKDGSYQAAHALLDHCANREIKDDMGRMPVDIANEKMHSDIIKLLEEHYPQVLSPHLAKFNASSPMFRAANFAPSSNLNRNPMMKQSSTNLNGSKSPPNHGTSSSSQVHNGFATLPRNHPNHSRGGAAPPPPSMDHTGPQPYRGLNGSQRRPSSKHVRTLSTSQKATKFNSPHDTQTTAALVSPSQLNQHFTFPSPNELHQSPPSSNLSRVPCPAPRSLSNQQGPPLAFLHASATSPSNIQQNMMMNVRHNALSYPGNLDQMSDGTSRPPSYESAIIQQQHQHGQMYVGQMHPTSSPFTISSSAAPPIVSSSAVMSPAQSVSPMALSPQSTQKPISAANSPSQTHNNSNAPPLYMMMSPPQSNQSVHNNSQSGGGSASSPLYAGGLGMTTSSPQPPPLMTSHAGGVVTSPHNGAPVRGATIAPTTTTQQQFFVGMYPSPPPQEAGHGPSAQHLPVSTFYSTSATHTPDSSPPQGGGAFLHSNNIKVMMHSPPSNNEYMMSSVPYVHQ